MVDKGGRGPTPRDDDPLCSPRRRGGARGPARSSASSHRREEVEPGLTGGAREVKAEEGVGEGDGETRQDALVDLGLAGAEEAAQLLGALAHRV